VSDPKDREPSDRKQDEDSGLSDLAQGYRKAAPYMAASSQLVGAVVVFTLGGWWLDQKLDHETPWLLLVGAGIGMTGGFISFFKTVLGKNKTPRS
jgi:F0F1-type ATP synthase assembly protein I